MSGDRTDPANWEGILAARIRGLDGGFVNRVMVLPDVGSTQDAALDLAAGVPGLMLIGVRQTAGRARLGRSWEQRDDLGLAVTFVLDAARYPAGQLSLAAGMAAAWAMKDRTRDEEFRDSGGEPFRSFGVRWPNDVVVPTPKPGGGRKVAGVLIEVRAGKALLGIGVNVTQGEADFPPELRSRAVSLRLLGSTAQRIDIAERLLAELDRSLGSDPRHLAEEWGRADVLKGSTQSFAHGGRQYTGRVERIDPMNEIVLEGESGQAVRLPALSTSLVRP